MKRKSLVMAAVIGFLDPDGHGVRQQLGGDDAEENGQETNLMRRSHMSTAMDQIYTNSSTAEECASVSGALSEAGMVNV
jgi:hypothetical protein